MKRKVAILLLALLFTNFWLISTAMTEIKKEEKAKKEKSISCLIEELKSDGKIIRANAAEQLGEKRNKDGTLPLVGVLKDKELTVKLQACMALGKIKDERAVTALIERLIDKKENWSVQVQAGEALAMIGDITAFQPLISTLKYECENWREKLDPPILKSFGSDDEMLESRIAEALFKLCVLSKNEYTPLLLTELKVTKEMSKFRYYLAMILGQLGEKEAVPVLIGYLESSENGLFREKVARILGDLNDKRAINPLKKALKDNFVLESTGDVHKIYGYTVRLAAYNSLKKMGLKIEKKDNEYEVIE